jgi:hypothetical protein
MNLEKDLTFLKTFDSLPQVSRQAHNYAEARCIPELRLPIYRGCGVRLTFFHLTFLSRLFLP